jgi:molybdopterin-guanine dinucleotide biosynthesis protein A
MASFTIMGAILAGGQSRRMGQDKAMLLIHGEPLLARAIRTVRTVTPEVAIIGPPERAALAPGAPVIPDRWPGAGPLGGIATALQALTSEAVLVVGCDMPFLNAALLRYLIELSQGAGDVAPVSQPTAGAVVVRLEGQAHPLHAVYHKSCLPTLEAQLAAGDLRVQRFLARLQVRYVEPPELDRFDPEHRSAFNANTPEEWEQALRLL